MIQRIQTIFLLLVIGLFAALFFMPLIRVDIAPGKTADYNITHAYAVLAAASLVAGLALVSIFLFRNRPLQMRICRINILISALLICFVLVLADSLFPVPQNSTIHFLPGAWAVIAFIPLNFLAARYIHKDEQLVRSADRLR